MQTSQVLTSANGTAFNPLTGLGELLFVGQVLNNDTISSNAINVTTQLFDFNGQLVGFDSTILPSLAPGAVGNFEQKFTDLDIVRGTPNAVFYEHDTNNASIPFFGFIPPPPLLTGLAPGGAGAAGGAIPGGAIGGGGGFIGGGGGFAGGGGGGTTINQEIINCIQNQANTANNISGGAVVGQNNFAVCKGKIIQQQQQLAAENKTTPGPVPLAAFLAAPPSATVENTTEPIENTTAPAPLQSFAAAPLECEEGFEEVDNECVPICEEGEELVDGECQPTEATCNGAFELVDGQCQLIQPSQTEPLQSQQLQQQQQQQEEPPEEEPQQQEEDPPEEDNE